MNRPLCSVCNKNLASKGNKAGTFKSKCSTCARGYSRSKKTTSEDVNRYKRPYLKYRKDHCEWPEGCDFKVQHPCQLTVDHVDGNNKNNVESNLMTLCHNHHALKTYLNDEYRPIGRRVPRLIDTAQ